MARELSTSINSTLIHSKRTKDNNIIDSTLLPITTYDNVMNRPKVITDMGNILGSPFVFFAQETVELDEDAIRELCGFSVQQTSVN